MQVSIDTNAALYAAVAGVIGLPSEFWDRIEECPTAGERVAAAQAVRDARRKEDQDAVDGGFIKVATADPNLTVAGPDNGLLVPRLPTTPTPVDDDEDVDAPDEADSDDVGDDADNDDEDAGDEVSDGR